MSDTTPMYKRIHISAHPADRYAYLEKVIKTVELIEGTSVSYCDSPCDGGCDLPDDTDLVILLASVKYFVWQNSGYQSEFLRAKERGVPVMPLMIEKEAMNLMNMRLGKLQYIDASEETGIDFALDTLYAHLANPVPKEVDKSLSSVFISYRKRDGEALASLLDVISRYPDRESFNLWYDQIIYPGDNYSYAIMNALTECDLFILLVSPALLEDGNYVMRVEYPTARKLNKRIIAVEDRPTDRIALAEKYPDLPKCINLKQSGAIYSALRALKNR